MQLFFAKNLCDGVAELPEDEAAHLIVLRKKIGDRLDLADGEGHFFEAELVELSKRSASARIVSQKKDPLARPFGLHVAIAPTKNLDRFEWFLEKSAELGISKITPLLSKRSERSSLRLDRCEKILLSAMKQSLRAALPKIVEPVALQAFLKNATEPHRFVAHCNEQGLPHLKDSLRPQSSALVLIGPEGDFSLDEVETAQKCGFVGCSLGSARLRTETAGVLACAVFSLANE